MKSAPALQIEGLTLEARGARVVDNLSLTVNRGAVVGIVGESGSGKSQTALAIGGLTPAGIRRTAGLIHVAGEAVRVEDQARLRALRGRSIAYVFQEPMTALNPTIRIGRQMRDIIAHCREIDGDAARALSIEMLESVHLADSKRVLRAYPHELSGGMRQRILIALAFACRPRLVVADEPTTALDVLVQAQVLSLLGELARTSDCGVLFISHDLAVVRQICSEVHVMQSGRIVESGTTDAILGRPRHDYTRTLISSSVESRA